MLETDHWRLQLSSSNYIKKKKTLSKTKQKFHKIFRQKCLINTPVFSGLVSFLLCVCTQTCKNAQMCVLMDLRGQPACHSPVATYCFLRQGTWSLSTLGKLVETTSVCHHALLFRCGCLKSTSGPHTFLTSIY